MATYIIDGRLTRDAEVRTTKDGREFVKFSVAWNRGNKKPPHYYDCTMNGDKASAILPYLTKGKYITASGEPDWNEYNNKVYETLRVDRINFISLGKSNESDNPDAKPYECDGKYFSTREEVEAYKEQTFGSSDDGPESFDDSDFDEDSIPF